MSATTFTKPLCKKGGKEGQGTITVSEVLLPSNNSARNYTKAEVVSSLGVSMFSLDPSGRGFAEPELFSHEVSGAWP